MTRNSCLPLLVGLALVWSANAAQAQVQGSGTPGQVPVWTDTSSQGNSVITQSPNNQIGIGTTTPTATLAVSGAGTYDAPGAARLDLFNTTAGDGYLQHVLDDGTWQIATINAAATRMVISPVGNVGIGTVTPGAIKLRVDGATGGFSGVFANGQDFGVVGVGNAAGVEGVSDSGIGVSGFSPNGYAGFFEGRVRITSIPAGSHFGTVCFNAPGDLVWCEGSSLRFKTNVQPFREGLSTVQRLRPISFAWKDDGMHDIGLAAEDVAQVAPSLTITNEKGEVEGVKYDRVNIVLINAINEQQAQIQRQEQQISEQRHELAALKTLLCSSHPDAEVCR
jgi:hypothetical protein